MYTTYPLFRIQEDMVSNGIKAPESIIADGKIHRHGIKKRHWYVVYLSPIIVCFYGDWKSNQKFKVIISDEHRTFSEDKVLNETLKNFAKSQCANRIQNQRESKRKAQYIWAHARDAIFHDYLKRKRVLPFGTKIDVYENLLVPLTDGKSIHSIQLIQPSGKKIFLKGGRTKGLYFSIRMERKPKEVLITEGFATAATLYMERKIPAVVAFNSGNLMEVSKNIRKRFPNTTITICGDNDHSTEGNPGKKAAMLAAKTCGGVWEIPDFTGFNPSRNETDFNDLYLMKLESENE